MCGDIRSRAQHAPTHEGRAGCEVLPAGYGDCGVPRRSMLLAKKSKPLYWTFRWKAVPGSEAYELEPAVCSLS